MNIIVFQWYCDQFAAFIGLFMAIIFFIMIIKKFLSSSIKHPPTLHISTYLVYTSYIILLILTALVGMGLTITNTNQFRFCKITVISSTLAYGLSQISLINLFIERLRLAFTNTRFELSKWISYVFRIVFVVAWIIVCVFAIHTVDASPLNIHTQETDYDGNGVTCSAITPGKQMTTGLIIAMAGNVLCVMFGNISILIAFLRKLHKLIKEIDRAHHDTNDTNIIDFVILMKDQALVVSLAVGSTLFFWLLTASGIFGTFFIIIDFIVNIFVVFLSFKFNRYYFLLFKCDKLALFCCRCMDKKTRSMNEAKLNEMMTKNEQTDETQTQTIEISTKTKHDLKIPSLDHAQLSQSLVKAAIPTVIVTSKTVSSNHGKKRGMDQNQSMNDVLNEIYNVNDDDVPQTKIQLNDSRSAPVPTHFMLRAFTAKNSNARKNRNSHMQVNSFSKQLD